jgi:hypothetical protein
MGHTDIKVTVVKDGKYWRVMGFGGGRSLIQGTAQPGDFVYSSGEEETAPSTASAEPAQAVKGKPVSLKSADDLIARAAKAWEAGLYGDAVTNAEQALEIYLAELGPDHPRIGEVQKMIDAARAKLNNP